MLKVGAKVKLVKGSSTMLGAIGTVEEYDPLRTFLQLMVKFNNEVTIGVNKEHVEVVDLYHPSCNDF